MDWVPNNSLRLNRRRRDTKGAFWGPQTLFMAEQTDAGTFFVEARHACFSKRSVLATMFYFLSAFVVIFGKVDILYLGYDIGQIQYSIGEI